jgi:hypothetical protein
MARNILAVAWVGCLALAACPSSVDTDEAPPNGSTSGGAPSSSQGGGAAGTTSAAGATGGGGNGGHGASSPVTTGQGGGTGGAGAIEVGSGGDGGTSNATGSGGNGGASATGTGGTGSVSATGTGGTDGTGGVCATGTGGTGGASATGTGGTGGTGGTIADAGPADAAPDAEPLPDAGVDTGQLWPACEALGPIAEGTESYHPCNCGASAQAHVEAIAQAAALAYQTSGAACLSATPVPWFPPLGTAYMPILSEGSDFNVGDAAWGWRCLDFSVDVPFCWQLHYVQGGDYLSPALGNLDPGPEGFEAAAIFDVDGDAYYGMIAVVGSIDPLTQQVTIHPAFLYQPLE